MSIFRREVEPPPAKTTPPPRPAANRSSSHPSAPVPSQDSAHIANGTKVVGEITGKSRLVIDGYVEGSIRLENEVVIGSQGHVKGSVVAESVQVGGKVHGNIRGIEKVQVLKSGGLEGDVVSPRVAIADGAFLKGKVEMTDNVGTVHSEPSSSGKGASSKAASAKGAPSKGTSPGNDRDSAAAAGQPRGGEESAKFRSTMSPGPEPAGRAKNPPPVGGRKGRGGR